MGATLRRRRSAAGGATHAGSTAPRCSGSSRACTGASEATPFLHPRQGATRSPASLGCSRRAGRSGGADRRPGGRRCGRDDEVRAAAQPSAREHAIGCLGSGARRRHRRGASTTRGRRRAARPVAAAAGARAGISVESPDGKRIASLAEGRVSVAGLRAVRRMRARAASGAVAAVTRVPNSMELVVRRRRTARCRTGSGTTARTWKGFELAPAGSASARPAPSPPCADPRQHGGVLRRRERRRCTTRYWYDGGDWQGFELRAVRAARPTGGIAAVSRIPGSMEVWYDRPERRRCRTTAGPRAATGSATSSRRPAAPRQRRRSPRCPGSRTAWRCGGSAPNGSVQGAYWYEGGQWQSLRARAGGQRLDERRHRRGVAHPDSMELWWVGANGSRAGRRTGTRAGSWAALRAGAGRAALASTGADRRRLPDSEQHGAVVDRCGRVDPGQLLVRRARRGRRSTLAPAGSATLGRCHRGRLPDPGEHGAVVDRRRRLAPGQRLV